MDKSILETRIASLKEEYKAGQDQLQHIQQRQRDLEATMLRIKGAIEVLEELLNEQNATQP